MKNMLVLIFICCTGFSNAQKLAVFGDINFDSSYSIIATSQSFRLPGTVAKQYCFLVSDLDEMNEMKKQWIVKTIHFPSSIEEYSIPIYIVKGKELVNSSLLIYPVQGLIYRDKKWYDLDMKKFTQVQSKHPLIYHSDYFKFEKYIDYVFFKDSIQSVPGFLFLIEPTKNEFEGQFDIIAPRTSDRDSPIFVLADINKELEKKFPSQKFKAVHVQNDSFNLESTSKVKIRVECFRSMYEAYNSKGNEKSAWMPSTFDTRVFFKD